MSPGRLNIKTRLELETRVLAAALKISLQKGDLDGARLAHSELSKLMRPDSGEDTAADAVNVTKPLDDASGEEPSAQPTIESNAESPAPPVAAPPVMGQLVRSPLGTPGMTGMPQPAPYQQTESSQKAQPDISSPDLGGQVAPSMAQTEPAPIFAGPRAHEMPDVDFSLQSTDEPSSIEISAHAEEPVTPETAPPTVPHLSLQQPAPPPQGNQPTASDALRRSIVNTPMRASASNMPAVRTIDENVLKSAGSPSGNDANQIKLSESLAKIEAAMNSAPEAAVGEHHAATASGQSDFSLEHIDEEPSRPDHQYQGLYRMLGVSQMSPYEEIHRNFLRRVRTFIRQINVTRRPEKLELLHNLRKIWIAHDILTDPVTRTDYDFRDLGLRGDVETIVAPAPEDKQQQQQTNRTPTRIGELLQCAGLLEPAELQIACDMHKAMPEVQFGTFLVKQGFIGERDLESVLLGQKLLRAGVISVAQFQVAMELSQSRGHNIGETLVERGYVTQDGLEKAVESIDAPPAGDSTPTPRIVDAVILTEAEPEYGQGLAAALLITDLVDFEPMDQSTASSSSNALTELLGAPAPTHSLPTTSPVPAVPAPPTSAFAAALTDSQPVPTPPPPAPPEPAVKVEQPAPALNLSQAVPSWKDQLDWDSPDTVQNSEVDPAAAVSPSVSETSDLNASSVPEAAEDSLRAKMINLGHAAPSWKDQLDWDSPEEIVPTPEFDFGATGDAALNAVASNDRSEEGGESDRPQLQTQNSATVTSENAPLSIMESGQDALNNDSDIGLSRSSHEITGDYDRYTVEEGSVHAETDESSGNGDTTSSTTGHQVASFFDSEKEVQPTDENEQNHEESDEDQGFLPGDDWVDIDPSVQMETAAHLQPITMDNLTLKQGRSGKKNKDKKKHK